MNNKIIGFITSVKGRLLFSLTTGLGYFFILFRFIKDMSNGSSLLAFFFAPFIVCGAALVIVKTIISACENKNSHALIRIFWLNIAVIVVGIVFALSLFN